MGTSAIKSDAQLQAERTFSSQELKQIEKQFHSHASKGKSVISAEEFIQMCQLNADELSDALWWAVTQGRECKELQLADAIIAKAKAERLGKEEAIEFTFKILCGLEGSLESTWKVPLVSSAAVSRGLVQCLRLLSNHSISEGEIGSVLAGMSSSPSDLISLDDYSRFNKSFPAIHETLASLLAQIEPKSDIHNPRFPKVLTNGVKSLLTPLDIWLIASCLPPDLSEEWNLIFNSDKDGLSFNTMMGRLGKCLAPSIIVIKDKGGSCFGGFANCPWAKSGQHYGDASTFVFGLRPRLSIYRASGINSNFLWCGIGFSQLANGIGFGGSAGQHSGHFSVFVDSQLEKGMSRPIATFGNDCLASSQVFEVDSIECWQIKPNEEEPQAPSRRGGGGALSEKNAVDRAFLATAGVQVNHSAGLSNEPIE